MQEKLGAAAESARPGGAGRRSKRRGRAVKLLVLGGAVAFAAKPAVRNRVLDALFGAEEQFDYDSLTEPVAHAILSDQAEVAWPRQTAEAPAADAEPDDDGPSWTFSNETDWSAAVTRVSDEPPAEEDEPAESSVDDQPLAHEDEQSAESSVGYEPFAHEDDQAAESSADDRQPAADERDQVSWSAPADDPTDSPAQPSQPEAASREPEPPASEEPQAVADVPVLPAYLQAAAALKLEPPDEPAQPRFDIQSVDAEPSAHESAETSFGVSSVYRPEPDGSSLAADSGPHVFGVSSERGSEPATPPSYLPEEPSPEYTPSYETESPDTGSPASFDDPDLSESQPQAPSYAIGSATPLHEPPAPAYEPPAPSSYGSPAPSYEPPGPAYESAAPYEPPAPAREPEPPYEPPAPAYESAAPYEPQAPSYPTYEPLTPPSYPEYDAPAADDDPEPPVIGSATPLYDPEPPAYESPATSYEPEPPAYESPSDDPQPAASAEPELLAYGSPAPSYEPEPPADDAAAESHDPEPAPYSDGWRSTDAAEPQLGAEPAPASEQTGEEAERDWGVPASESHIREDPPTDTPMPLEPQPVAAADPVDQEQQAPEAPAEAAAEEEPAIGEAGPPPRGGWWLSRRRKGSNAAPEPPRWD